MFEQQYNDEMVSEVRRIEALQRATAAGHPEWVNACARCGSELRSVCVDRCQKCGESEPGVMGRPDK